MMRPDYDLSTREVLALERGRQKAELIAWLRREAASRNGDMFWYVAQTRWRADSVAGELRGQGIEAVCPKSRYWQRYPGSRSRFPVEKPVFGNYLFVRTLKAESAWVGVLSFEGIKSLRGDGERPLPITKKEEAQILALLEDASTIADREANPIAVGDKVLHPLGSIAELHGEVLELDPVKREALVSTVLFGRELSTRCSIDDLEKLA